MSGITGVVVQSTFNCPRGRVVEAGWRVLMHPADHMAMRNNGRTPLWTRHMAGVRELERDRRFPTRASLIFEPPHPPRCMSQYAVDLGLAEAPCTCSMPEQSYCQIEGAGSVWARWWLNDDATVTHVHYSNDGERPIAAVLNDRDCDLFVKTEASR